MKKFAFTLDRLRNYRERLLDEEKNKLGQLRMIQIQIEERIAQLEQAFTVLAGELLAEQQAGLPAYKLKSYDIKMTSVRNQLKQLARDLVQATEAVDVQMGVVVLASQEVSKLDKLEEKQREDYNMEVRKAEANEIEEFVSSDTIRKMIS